MEGSGTLEEQLAAIGIKVRVWLELRRRRIVLHANVTFSYAQSHGNIKMKIYIFFLMIMYYYSIIQYFFFFSFNHSFNYQIQIFDWINKSRVCCPTGISCFYFHKDAQSFYFSTCMHASWSLTRASYNYRDSLILVWCFLYSWLQGAWGNDWKGMKKRGENAYFFPSW